MKITAISDLHGHFPKLNGGDLLIIGGDLTKSDSESEYFEFFDWVDEQEYKKKILVAGNHDNRMQKENYKGPKEKSKDRLTFLCDSGIQFQGRNIWGSPWTKTFEGMNPKCKAFTVNSEFELLEKWKLIPADVDILITHCPPYGILDGVKNAGSGKIENVGSYYLTEKLQKILEFKSIMHICGHIHEGYGKMPFSCKRGKNIWTIYNCSHVNEKYEPVNPPREIELKP